MSWGFRNKARLDFDHTCPVIDDGIQFADCDILEAITNIMPEGMDNLASDLHDAVMKVVTDAFESVRSTNIKMRDAADKQIADLHDDLDESKERVKELERRVDSLEDKIERLEMEMA